MSNLAIKIQDTKQEFWNELTPKQVAKLEMIGHGKAAPQNITMDDARMLGFSCDLKCRLIELKRIVGLRLLK